MPRQDEYPHLWGLQVLWKGEEVAWRVTRRPIEDRVVTALGKHWHVEHFACAKYSDHTDEGISSIQV